MSWILLIIGGLFEVAFASCLGKAKETSGMESTYWMLGFLVSLTISMFLLYKATQVLPIGTAYAVWTGIGAVGTVFSGDIGIQRACYFLETFFYNNTNLLYCRIKICVESLKS